MPYKRTKTTSGGATTKTRSRVRKDGTTVTKTKTKSNGTKSKSRSVVGKKTTSGSTRSVQMNLPNKEFQTDNTPLGKVKGIVDRRRAEGTEKTVATSQSGKARSKTKVRGKGKVKTKTRGTRGTSQSTTTTTRIVGREVYDPTGNDIGSFTQPISRNVNESFKGGVKNTSNIKTKVKRKGKMSRDIPLPPSNF
jgi:hypothetical protein